MDVTPGHVFVVHSDLEQVLCDVYVLPASAEGLGREDRWQRLVPRKPVGTSGWRSGVERVSAPVPTATGGQALFVNSGGHAGSTVEWLFTGVRAGFGAALGLSDSATPLNGRARPLIGVTLFGTGGGGFRDRRGDVVRGLVRQAQALAAQGPDVVIVCRDRASYSAVQYERRRLDPEPLTSSVEMNARRLASAARQGRLALFLGAGVSMGAGLPSWEELIQALAKASARWGGDPAALGRSVLDAATLLRADMGEAFPRELRRALSQRGFALGHALLATLQVQGCITTNFDHMYERAVAATRSGDRPTRIPSGALTGVDRDEPWVVKMHGDVDDETVLTREDFLDFDDYGRPLRGIVQTQLMTQHLLLVGCSMTDDNVIKLAHEVKKALARQGGATSERALGSTLLTAWPDEILNELWGSQLEVVAAAPSNDRHGRLIESPDAFRAVDIFLDRVAFHASVGEGSFLVDDTFGELGDDHDRSIAGAVKKLKTALAGSGPQWDDLRTELDRAFEPPHRSGRTADALAAELGATGKELRGWLRRMSGGSELPFLRRHVKHERWRFTELQADLVKREWTRRKSGEQG